MRERLTGGSTETEGSKKKSPLETLRFQPARQPQVETPSVVTINVGEEVSRRDFLRRLALIGAGAIGGAVGAEAYHWLTSSSNKPSAEKPTPLSEGVGKAQEIIAASYEQEIGDLQQDNQDLHAQIEQLKREYRSLREENEELTSRVAEERARGEALAFILRWANTEQTRFLGKIFKESKVDEAMLALLKVGEFVTQDVQQKAQGIAELSRITQEMVAAIVALYHFFRPADALMMRLEEIYEKTLLPVMRGFREVMDWVLENKTMTQAANKINLFLENCPPLKFLTEMRDAVYHTLEFLLVEVPGKIEERKAARLERANQIRRMVEENLAENPDPLSKLLQATENFADGLKEKAASVEGTLAAAREAIETFRQLKQEADSQPTPSEWQEIAEKLAQELQENPQMTEKEQTAWVIAQLAQKRQRPKNQEPIGTPDLPAEISPEDQERFWKEITTPPSPSVTTGGGPSSSKVK